MEETDDSSCSSSWTLSGTTTEKQVILDPSGVTENLIITKSFEKCADIDCCSQ